MPHPARLFIAMSLLLLQGFALAEAWEDQQRAYALAKKPSGRWENRGSALRGEKIFGDPEGPLAGICATCHRVRGLGGDIGPDLSLVGSAHDRAELITSILEPSQLILFGYEQVMIETTDGETFVGALRQETRDSLTVKGADGQPHTIAKADIRNRKPLPTSLMPAGLTRALTPAQFTDLLAYLERLRGD